MLTKICGLPIFLQDYEKGSNHSRSRVIATSSSEFVSYKVFQFSALLHSLISACLVKPIKKKAKENTSPECIFFLSPHAFNNASFSSFDKICSHFCGVLRNLNSWCIFMLGLFERVAPLLLSAGKSRAVQLSYHSVCRRVSGVSDFPVTFTAYSIVLLHDLWLWFDRCC